MKTPFGLGLEPEPQERSIVFTLAMRGVFLTSASKFNIEPNDGIFDVSPENDRASPNVKTSFPTTQEHGDVSTRQRKMGTFSLGGENVPWAPSTHP